MCKEHSWDCVQGQRPVRLGFRRHEPGGEKVLGVVSSRDGLCLASCCLEVNTRLFGCVAACCWGRVSLSDRRCAEKCCGGSGISQVSSQCEILEFFYAGCLQDPLDKIIFDPK